MPVLDEVEYAKRVVAHGKSDLLVQRTIRGVGHCDFTGAELVTAFLDPATVVDGFFGCAFTDGDHLLGTPCP